MSKSLDLVKENIAANPEGDPVLYYNAVMNGAKSSNFPLFFM